MARTYVLDHARMKIQNYSADYMETYGSTNMSLAAQVNKQPSPGGGFLIVAKFWCGSILICFPDQWDTLDEFNRTVAATGVQH